jgi:hypothetical protein
VKINFAIVILLFLFCACGSKKTVVPSSENIIPFKQMEQVLKDIHLADGMANREGDPNGTAEALTKEYYKAVFKKYNITDSIFYKSFRYYMYEAGMMDSMYNNIITDISKKQAEIQAQ